MSSHLKFRSNYLLVFCTIFLAIFADTMGLDMTPGFRSDVFPRALSFPWFIFVVNISVSPGFEYFTVDMGQTWLGPLILYGGYGAIFSIGFAIWNRDLWQQRITMPTKLTRVVVAVLLLLSAVHYVDVFVGGYDSWMADNYALSLAMLSFVFTIAIIYYLWRTCRTPNFANIIAFRLIFLMWLSWLALPYIGELP